MAPEMLRLLNSAFEAAWTATQEMIGKKPLKEGTIRGSLATRIMAAADKGERDPKPLKLIVLQAIDAIS